MITLLVLLILKQSAAVIYELNETEYSRMPAVYAVDQYEQCANSPGAVYCTLNATLHAHTHSHALMDLIQEYSADTLKHYNHSSIFRGVCVSSFCPDYYKTTSTGNSSDERTRLALERCLNASLGAEYGLGARIHADTVECQDTRYRAPLDVTPGDVLIAVILLGILLINVIGTFKGGKYWDCFSVRRNLQSVFSFNTKTRSSSCVNSINGLRTVQMWLVISLHTGLVFCMFIDNTHFIEQIYYKLYIHTMFNGTLVVQSFFLISAFLLVDKLQREETEQPGRDPWTKLPANIFQRWMRLTPPYAVCVAFTSTWQRHVSSGIVWSRVVLPEVRDCHSYWWMHLLYINNYYDHSTCYPQSWYVAADMQLHVLGSLVCACCRGVRARACMLAALAVLGVLAPAAHTYTQDLDGNVLASPESAKYIFTTDRTFNMVYRRTHNNLFSFCAGMTLAFLVHHLQNNNFNIQKYKRYVLLYWSTAACLVGVLLSGAVWYRDGPRAALALRVLYAALVKPVYCFLIAVLIFGFVFKYERVYRGVLEWRVWTVCARLSYCAYLVHIILIKTIMASMTHLLHVTEINVMVTCSLITLCSFVAAAPLCVLVEEPARRVTALLTAAPRTPRKLVEPALTTTLV